MAIWLRYLPVNQAHAFFFGDKLQTASLIGIGPDDKRLFETRAEAVSLAESLGLTVARNGQTTVKNVG